MSDMAVGRVSGRHGRRLDFTRGPAPPRVAARRSVSLGQKLFLPGKYRYKSSIKRRYAL
jgi:hypothetical protein